MITLYAFSTIFPSGIGETKDLRAIRRTDLMAPLPDVEACFARPAWQRARSPSPPSASA